MNNCDRNEMLLALKEQIEHPTPLRMALSPQIFSTGGYSQFQRLRRHDFGPRAARRPTWHSCRCHISGGPAQNSRFERW